MENSGPMNLIGRRILVTGAASGIGLATARLLSSLGARIAAVDLNADTVATEVLRFDGAGHTSHAFDLRDLDGIPSWMAELAACGGPFYGLVHAAGLSCVQPVRLLEPARYRDALLVNTEAALALARGFQRKAVFEVRGGSIVLISSVMAVAGSPGTAAYGMTKAALIGLAKSLAVELAPKGIRVNCVAPGYVKTPMFDRVSAVWDEGQRAGVEAEHPLGLGEPGDVANAIAFLLADTARWITGSVMFVDGGYTAH